MHFFLYTQTNTKMQSFKNVISTLYSSFGKVQPTKRQRTDQEKKCYILMLSNSIIGYICSFIDISYYQERRIIDFLSALNLAQRRFQYQIYINTPAFVNFTYLELNVRFRCMRVCAYTWPTREWLFSLQHAHHVEIFGCMMQPLPEITQGNNIKTLSISGHDTLSLECFGALHSLVHLSISVTGTKIGEILAYISNFIVIPLKSFSVLCFEDVEITDEELTKWRNSGAISPLTVVDLGNADDPLLLNVVLQSLRIGMSVRMFSRIDRELLDCIQWLGLNHTWAFGPGIDWHRIAKLKSLRMIGIFNYFPHCPRPIADSIVFKRPTIIAVSGYEHRYIKETTNFAKVAFDLNTVKGWIIGPHQYPLYMRDVYKELRNVHIVEPKKGMRVSISSFPFLWTCANFDLSDSKNPVVINNCDTLPPTF